MRTRLKVSTALVASASLLAAAPIASAADRHRDLKVDTKADSTDARPGNGRCADERGRCSLRAAVQEANARRGDDKIELRGSTFRLRIAGAGEDAAASGDLDVTGKLTIDGNGLKVDANDIDRAFDVRAGAKLAVKDLIVTGGSPPETESGGGFRSAGTLSLKGSRVVSNVVRGMGASGGGIFNDQGKLYVDDSRIDHNKATRAGGGIEANAGSTWLDEVRLSRNDTGAGPGNGGGLHLTGAGAVEVDRSRVVGNTATAEGGGLWNSATGTMHVSRTRLAFNVASGAAADEGGGALFSDGGRLTVERSELVRNRADGAAGSGGGILNNLGTLHVERSELDRNTATRAGGGIEANIGTTTLDRVVLKRNHTGDNPGNGGGLHLTGAGTVTIDDGTVVDNSAAAEGGGLWNSATGTMTVTDTRIQGNRAPVGPNVYNDGGTFTVDGQPVPPGV